MPKQLRVITGPDEGLAFPLPEAGMVSIGRSHQHSDICLHDLNLARIHCNVEVSQDEISVVDFDSVSGTFVNGERVSRRPLKHADIIRIGETQLCYESGDEPEPASQAAAPASAAFSTECLNQLASTTLGSFELGPVSGRGHSGLVFRAQDKKQDRTVALKVLHPHFPKNDAEMQSFIRALKVVMPLRHPNLVTVYGAGRTGSWCWVAMEYVEGESLAQVMERIGTSGLPDWRQAFRLAVHMGRALHFASCHNLVHGNITPQNILWRQTDHLLKLSDLAQAKALAGSLLKQLTLRSGIARDLFYLSPEQTRAQACLDHRSDIYNLGTVVYTLLTGRPPFVGDSSAATLTLIREADPPSPCSSQPATPAAFASIVLRMLAKRAEDRYQTAKDLLIDLMQIAPDPE